MEEPWENEDENCDDGNSGHFHVNNDPDIPIEAWAIFFLIAALWINAAWLIFWK